MFGTIGWFIEMALKVLGLFAGIWAFGWLVKNGLDPLKDFMRTIAMTIKVVCAWIRDKLISSMEKGSKDKQDRKGKHEPITYDEFCRRNGYPTKEEFDRMMEHKDAFNL